MLRGAEGKNQLSVMDAGRSAALNRSFLHIQSVKYELHLRNRS